ncbi:MAG: alpha/beta fold hydrolase, partial [Alphaproteobacteria bacterium]|nr:alpha/beta fold hydrolase [Alphaproteobacteria bacterium]
MGDRIFNLIGREGSAFVLGAGLILAGVLTVRAAPVPGALLVALGALMCLGSFVHRTRLAGRPRPPGRLVDIGGTRIHVVAEGEANGVWPVVWFGGGHSAGLAMDHLHRALRTRTRSILVDRPGTGWSDTGRFPRRTDVEADEMIRALEASGERGPFVLVGYSFGGLLAANMARRRPDLVARLVLLDATPLETILLGPRLGALRQMRREALLSGLLRLVGIPANLTERRLRREAGGHAALDQAAAALGPALATLRAVEIGAGHQLAAWSSFADLHGPGIAARGWEISVYDGDLGDLPLWLVA